MLGRGGGDFFHFREIMNYTILYDHLPFTAALLIKALASLTWVTAKFYDVDKHPMEAVGKVGGFLIIAIPAILYVIRSL
jgi:hypothetical protein